MLCIQFTRNLGDCGFYVFRLWLHCRIASRHTHELALCNWWISSGDK